MLELCGRGTGGCAYGVRRTLIDDGHWVALRLYSSVHLAWYLDKLANVRSNPN